MSVSHRFREMRRHFVYILIKQHPAKINYIPYLVLKCEQGTPYYSEYIATWKTFDQVGQINLSDTTYITQ